MSQYLRVAAESARYNACTCSHCRLSVGKWILSRKRSTAPRVAIDLTSRRRICASRAAAFDLILTRLAIALQRRSEPIRTVGRLDKGTSRNREVRVWILGAHRNGWCTTAVQRIRRILWITCGWPWTRDVRPQRNHTSVTDRLQTSAFAILRRKRRIQVARENSWAGVYGRADAVSIEANLVENNSSSTSAKGGKDESSRTAKRSDHALGENIAANIRQSNAGIVRNIRRRQGRVLGADNRIRNRVESSTITAEITQRVSLAAAQEPGSRLNYRGALNLAGHRSHVRKAGRAIRAPCSPA